MAASQEEDGVISAINVTPLVDVVLVLLIILMVTAQFTVQQAIAIELPKAESGEEATPLSVSISISAQGELYLDGAPIGERALRARLMDLKRKDAELQTVIAADGKVEHERVVFVMDLLRGLGISKLSFNVDPRKS